MSQDIYTVILTQYTEPPKALYLVPFCFSQRPCISSVAPQQL